MGLRMRSFLPSRRGSLRVATTVPTTRARIMKIPSVRLLSGGLRLNLADGEDILQALMGAGDDVDGDEFADTPGGGGAGIGGGAHGRDIPANHGGDVAGSNLLPADEVDLSGFHHGVGSLDHGHQTARFDHS